VGGWRGPPWLPTVDLIVAGPWWHAARRAPTPAWTAPSTPPIAAPPPGSTGSPRACRASTALSQANSATVTPPRGDGRRWSTRRRRRVRCRKEALSGGSSLRDGGARGIGLVVGGTLGAHQLSRHVPVGGVHDQANGVSAQRIGDCTTSVIFRPRRRPIATYRRCPRRASAAGMVRCTFPRSPGQLIHVRRLTHELHQVSAELCGVRAEQRSRAIQLFSPVEVELAW
jgi:hypothetical protein